MGRTRAPERDRRPPTFTDARIEARFRADGYVVVPLVDPASVAATRAALAPLVPSGIGPFFGPYRQGDSAEHRRAIDEVVRPLVTGALGDLLQGQRTFLGTLLVKAPGRDGFLGLHRDIAFTDERDRCSGIVWLPLEPLIGDRTGRLLVVPGSHLLPTTLRGVPPGRTDIADVEGRLLERAVAVPVPLGHAVVYDNRLVHGSEVNATGRPRLAAATGFVPADREIHHFVTSPDGKVWCYQVTDAFFLTEYDPPADWWLPTSTWRPEATSSVLRADEWHGDPGRPVAAGDLAALDGGHRRRLRRWFRPTGS